MSRIRETLPHYGFLWNFKAQDGENVIHQNSFQEENYIHKEMLGQVVLGQGVYKRSSYKWKYKWPLKEEAVQLLEFLVSVCPKFGVETGSDLNYPAE